MFNAKSFPMAKVLLLVAAAVLLGGNASAAEKDKIAARLAAPGSVCVFGEECAKGMKVPGAPTGPKTPESVYNGFCQACHATGANNAPKFGDAVAWKPRIAKGLPALYESALNGFNKGAMPPKGTCMDCTDDEIKATVEYITKAAKK